MNTLKIEAKLAEKYKYQPLPEDLSAKYRDFFKENIPSLLTIDGANDTLITSCGTPVCSAYDRIVIGDYGAFVEFSKEDIVSEFIIQPGQEYRVYDDKYKKSVKYVWLTINDDSHIKIYEQKRRVRYADYKPNKYYVSVHEVLTTNNS